MNWQEGKKKGIKAQVVYTYKETRLDYAENSLTFYKLEVRGMHKIIFLNWSGLFHPMDIKRDFIAKYVKFVLCIPSELYKYKSNLLVPTSISRVFIYQHCHYLMFFLPLLLNTWTKIKFVWKYLIFMSTFVFLIATVAVYRILI